MLCDFTPCSCIPYPKLGTLNLSGGVGKILHLEDMKGRRQEELNAFDMAILAHQERKPVEVPQCKFSNRFLYFFCPPFKEMLW